MAEQRGRAGALVDLVGPAHRYVGAEPAGSHDDVECRVRIGAEHAFGGLFQQFERSLDRQLVGREIVGQGPGGVSAPQVRAEAPHSGDHRLSIGVEADGDAVDLRRVDVCQPVVGDEEAQAARHLGCGCVLVAEIELRQPRLGVAFAAGDLIEVLFHAGGQRVVDEAVEVPLHQPHGGERGECRNQR